MAITHCIAHAIHRNGPEAAVELRQAQAQLTLTGTLEELVRELKHAYIGKAGKQYGRFDEDASVAIVGQWLRQCQQETLSFEAFSQKATEHFQQLLSNTDVALDGYFLFALEELADSQCAYVFLVQPNEGVWLDGELKLQKSYYLDVRGVSAAAKVELTDWQADENASYLSVLRARGDKALTECFTQWVGFADVRDTAAETKVFLDAVTEFSEQLEPQEAHTCRNKIVDYCLEQDKKGEPVVIRELSEQIDDHQPERFVRYLEEKKALPEQSLHPDRRQMKQYVRISGRNDYLSMSFAAECLGESVVYDKSTDSLVINNLPAPLKLRLVQYLQSVQQLGQQQPAQQQSVQQEPVSDKTISTKTSSTHGDQE